MSEIDRAIDDASKLPLFDAAYALWRMKEQLDRVDPQQEATPPRPIDLKDERALGKAVRAAIANVLHERNTAHEGPTFGRLKRAHPEAKDEDLKRAIREARGRLHEVLLFHGAALYRRRQPGRRPREAGEPRLSGANL